MHTDALQVGSPNNRIITVQRYERFLDEVYDEDSPDPLGIAIVLLVSAIGSQMDQSRPLCARPVPCFDLECRMDELRSR